PAIGIPAHTDDVVMERDGQVQHRPVLIVALEANGLVLVLLRPAMDGFHQLGGDSLAAILRYDAVKPGEEDSRLQLEADEKANRPVADPGDELQDVITSTK